MTNLQQTLHNISTNLTSPIWQRLDTHIKQMTPEQLAFVNNNEQNIQKKKQMNDVFIEWLFTKYRDEFVEDSRIKPIVEDYTNSIIETSKEYVTIQSNMQQEYEAMKKELEELRKLKNEVLV